MSTTSSNTQNAIIDNEIRSEQNTHDRKEFVTTKKPAPKAGDNSDYMKIRNERKAARKAAFAKSDLNEVSAAAAVADSTYQKLRDDRAAENAAKQQAKREARLGYLKRLEKRMESMKLTSPKNDISLNNRVLYYGRNHKCPHGYKHDRIRRVGDEYIFSCSCAEVRPIGARTENKCQACGGPTTTPYRNVNCECKHYLCTHCHRRTYFYNYGGEHVAQYYDKHSYNSDGITVTIGREDIVDCSELFKKKLAAKPETTNKSEGKVPSEPLSFAAALQGDDRQTAPTAKVETPKTIDDLFTQRDQRKSRKQKVKNLPKVDTQNEGGITSKATSEKVDSGFFKNKLDKIKQAFEKAKENIIQKFANKYISNTVKKIFDAIKFILEYLVEICVSVTPSHICELLLVMKDGVENNIIRILACLTSIVADIIKQEEIARSRLVLLAMKHRTGNDDKWCDVQKMAKEVTFYNFRTLHAVFHLFAGRCTKFGDDKIPFVIVLESINKMGIHTSSFLKNLMTSNTVNESGGMSYITSFLGMLPKVFRKYITPLSEIARSVIPLLSVVKLTSDVTKIVSTVSKSIYNWITGRIQDTSKWIASQSSDEESPIGRLLQAYLAYQMALCSVDDNGTTQLRGDFYTRLAEAEVYVADNKRLGRDWTGFRKHLESGMTSVPSLKSREFEPTVLVLSGKAGTGKSTLWRAVVGHEFKCAKLSKVDDITHTWQINSDYQTGMAGKEIILFDDFAQDRKSEEALAVINLVSRAPMAVMSANIIGQEVKGMQVAPKLLVLCTNSTAELAGQDLVATDALKRRFDLDIEVLKKIDFDNLDDKIGKIKSCSAYRSLIGTEVSYREIQQLFTLVHRKKHSEFVEVSEKLEAIYEDGLLPNLNIERGEIIGSSTWQKDDSFMADWEKYVVHPPTVPTDDSEDEDEEPVVTKKEDKSLFSKIKNKFATAATKNEDGKPASVYYMDLAGQVLYSGMLYAVPVSLVYVMTESLNHIYSGLTHAALSCLGTYPKLQAVLYPILKCTLATATTFGMVFLAYKAITNESGTTKTAKAKLHKLTVDTSNESGNDHLHDLFKKATGTLRNTETGETINCIFVAGHYVLTARHFFIDYVTGTYHKEGTVMSVISPQWKNGAKEFKFENNRLVKIAYDNRFLGDSGYRADVIMYKLDERNFSASKNILPHFWDGSYSVLNHPITKIDLSGYQSDGSYDGTFEISYSKVNRDQVLSVRVEGEVKTYHIYAESNYVCRPSSCGSLIRLTNSQSAPLIGIHTARGVSNPNASYFHFVTRQGLEKAIENDKAAILDLDHDMVITTQESSINFLPAKTTLRYLGKSELRTFQNTKTTLKPSLVFECFGKHKTEPSVLSSQDPRLPPEYKGEGFFREIFSGYVARDGCFEVEDLLPAYNSLKEQFASIIRRSIVRPKILTLHEAINGIKHLPANTRMDMSTSCGYPYVCKGLTKKKLFEVQKDDEILPSNLIKEDYYKAMKQISKGIVPFTPFILTLKDERLKLAKIEKPKSRLFACGNVINFLICRSYFYTFMMACYHADLKDLFFRPAMDRLSLDWNEYISYMIEVGYEGFDFDFKFFDRTLSHTLLHLATDIMLTGQNVTPREKATLLELICSPVMIWNDEFFTSSGINMSGVLITYTVNCIVNELMHRAAWTFLAKKHSPRHSEIATYRKYVRGMRGGDDTVTTVHPNVILWYNGQSVAEYLNSKGLEVTSPNKDKDIEPFQQIFKLSFLKNKTAMKYGFFIPLPELDSLIESCYWIRLNKHNLDPVEATQDNVNCALRGVFFHGEELFNKMRDKMLDICPELQLVNFPELSVIWKEFFYFPGAHSDYATRDEGKFEKTDVKPHKQASLGPRLINNMIDAETINESGKAIDAVAKSNMHQEMTSPRPDTATKPEASHEPGEVGEFEPQQADVTALDGSTKRDTTTVGTNVSDGDQVSKLNPKLGRLTPSSKNLRATSVMNDTDWTLSKLEKKYTFIKNVTWSISDPVDHSLALLNIPTDVIVTAAQKAPFDATTFYKFKQVSIKLVVKASPFYAGCIIAGFVPISNIANNYRLVENNGVIAKLSQDESIEFDIPFRFHKGYLVDAQNIGTFHIHVLSPLVTGPDNPSTVDIAVYAAVEDAIFKVPEIIPTNAYVSHKFDRNTMIVHTIPESGRAIKKSAPIKEETPTEKKSQAININNHVHDLRPVVLCAGEGLVTSCTPSHFQDAPTDLVQLMKRWRRAASIQVKQEVLKITSIEIPFAEILDAAAGILPNMFAFWRGSIMLRASITRLTADAIEPTGYIAMKVNRHLEGEEFQPLYQHQNLAGFHHFDEKTSGQVMIPYMARTFISPYGGANIAKGDEHIVFIDICNGNGTWLLDIDIALGDDFHTGLFTGTGYNFSFLPMNFTLKEFPYETTNNEAGIIDFVDRAIETTLPVAECVSALGSLLDAHPITYQPYPVQNRSRPLSIACDLVNYKETLITTNHNGMSLPDKDTFGMNGKETDIKNLLTGVKSFSQRFPWNSSDASGKLLIELGCGPEAQKPTLIDQLPRFFNYWRGGTIYIFDIIATEMHRGQLIFSYSPYGKKATQVSEATQTYFTTYDLSKGRGTLAIMCPYLSEYQYSAMSNLDGTGDWTYPGILQVFVQNPLRASTTVAPNVEVLVYKTYASDFDVAVFGNNQLTELKTKRAIKPPVTPKKK